jgi:hypothetical protein
MYLGEEDGIADVEYAPSKEKIEPLLRVRKPRDADELKVYFGFVNYYGRFFPHKSTMLHPLFRLTQKDVP